MAGDGLRLLQLPTLLGLLTLSSNAQGALRVGAPPVFNHSHFQIIGGGGGELNSPSRKRLPEYATGLVGRHIVA